MLIGKYQVLYNMIIHSVTTPIGAVVVFGWEINYLI